MHVDYIPILHHIRLTFHPYCTLLLGFYHVPCGYEVVIVDHFGAEEAAFEV